jgi:hypothetical protein
LCALENRKVLRCISDRGNRTSEGRGKGERKEAFGTLQGEKKGTQWPARLTDDFDSCMVKRTLLDFCEKKKKVSLCRKHLPIIRQKVNFRYAEGEEEEEF